MSAMTALDYIYQTLDSTIASYDHAGCDLGSAPDAQGSSTETLSLFCQTVLKGDVTLEPISKSKVLKDLITKKGEGQNSFLSI